jgi:hypothetical protein
MGQHSIIDKLRGELELPLKRESQALYLMAEVRKYIEHEKSIHETYDVTTRKKLAFHYYPELEFFCNWALHIKIDRPHNADNIKTFLRAFDMKPGMGIEAYLASNFFQEIMHLAILRSELHRFLVEHSLPEIIVTEHKSWSAFIYLYTSIVSEVPLEYSKGDLLPEEVQKVELARLGRLPSTPEGMTRWTITLKNEKSFSSSTLY